MPSQHRLRAHVLCALLATSVGGCAHGDDRRTVAPTAAPRRADEPAVPAPSPAASGRDAAAPSPSADGGPVDAGAPTAESATGMVVSDAALATRVGQSVLASGGNAVDAAVATALALAVVFPTAGNIGGGGFLVARVGGRSVALDFRETAPAAATRTMYSGDAGAHDAREGWRAVAVPGSVAGLWEAWRALGSKRKTWAEVVAPAIALADDGFVVDAAFVETIVRADARLAKFPTTAALFLPGGAPPPVGSRFRNPDLAKVLRAIAAEGPAGFYEGPVAETLARSMRESGGLITAADLHAYRAKWRTPIEFDYRGRHVVGMPPPSSGGVTTALIAHLLSSDDLARLGWHSAAHVHLVAEAMRRAFAARNRVLGDPDFVPDGTRELLSAAWARAQRATIRTDRATPTDELTPDAGTPARGADAMHSHTTHLSAVDGEGNAVALTTTLNAWFGSGVTVPGLGVVLNDEMDDFASAPGRPNMFGLVQGDPNSIEPGKRMLSSMSPSIVLGGDGRPELVLGAAGGSTIITTVFEELSNAVDFGMSPANAVEAPRFHQQDLPDVLVVEPHAVDDAVAQQLEAMGHHLKPVDHIADAPAIGRTGPLWVGVAEPRRHGGLALGL